jgi:sugar-phosphatase
MKCRVVLFDLDGVLIDSSACIIRHWTEWACRHGMEPGDVLSQAHGVRTIETMRRVAPHLDCDREADEFCRNEIVDTEGIEVIEGAATVLAALPMDAWTIVTSCSRDLARARLLKAGLPVPPVMVTAEDVAQGKPSPEPYLAGARLMGMRVEDCVVVEDSPSGVESGKRAGMRVLGIASTHSVSQLREKHADQVLSRLIDLRPHWNAGHLFLTGDEHV